MKAFYGSGAEAIMDWQELFCTIWKRMTPHMIAMLGAIVLILHTKRSRTETLTKIDVLYFLLSGVGTAWAAIQIILYFVPAAVSFSGALGFFLGLTGGVIIPAALRTIKEADLWDFIKTRWGGKR